LSEVLLGIGILREWLLLTIQVIERPIKPAII